MGANIGRPKEETQGLVDGLEITVRVFEQDPEDDCKSSRVLEKQEELSKHYETLEKNARKLSHVNWLQLGDDHTAFFSAAIR